MINNLKKIEKSIKQIESSDLDSLYLSSLLKTLKKERVLHYQNEELFFQILNNEVKGLNTLNILKHMKLRSKRIDQMFSTMNLSIAMLNDNFINKELFLESDQNFFASNRFGLDVFVRTPIMKSIVIEKILEGKCSNLLTEGLSLMSKGSVNFNFDMNMFNDEDKESLKDILTNLKAYLKHPDVGYANLERELDNILKKHYNTHLIYIKNEKENCIYEIEVKK